MLTTTLTKENYQVGAKEISVTRERERERESKLALAQKSAKLAFCFLDVKGTTYLS